MGKRCPSLIVHYPFSIASLPDDLDQHAFGPLSVEFAVEDLLPGAEVEFAFGDGDDRFPAHDLAFHMRIGVVLAGAGVVFVLSDRRMRGELFEPLGIVLVQAGLVVVDEYRGGDVHGIGEQQPLACRIFSPPSGTGR